MLVVRFNLAIFDLSVLFTVSSTTTSWVSRVWRNGTNLFILFMPFYFQPLAVGVSLINPKRKPLCAWRNLITRKFPPAEQAPQSKKCDPSSLKFCALKWRSCCCSKVLCNMKIDFWARVGSWLILMRSWVPCSRQSTPSWAVRWTSLLAAVAIELLGMLMNSLNWYVQWVSLWSRHLECRRETHARCYVDDQDLNNTEDCQINNKIEDSGSFRFNNFNLLHDWSSSSIPSKSL